MYKILRKKMSQISFHNFGVSKNSKYTTSVLQPSISKLNISGHVFHYVSPSVNQGNQTHVPFSFFQQSGKNQIHLNFQKNSLKKSKIFSFSEKNFGDVEKTKFFPKESMFLNFSFDKGRLKTIVSWFLEKYGQYKTIQFLEKLKEFGFGYATLAGLSLGIDDLKVPNQKIQLLAKAETLVTKDLVDYRNAKITGIERMQRLIYVWNQTNDTLKQEVLKYFETTDLFNPIYMMAFSGARGNMSQVRQLVGMRGLMSDPQGQIIDFPIQSNFREGLTLTEYLISTYGARKGIVDTALRTATAGYLTRRLVDVAQHVIVSQFDCGTMRGIFLFDMKEANKTIYSFQNRLIGRVLAQDIFQVLSSHEFESTSLSQNIQIASRNQEIDSTLARAISKVTKKAFVRSPLTCETPRLICQLCYGWSLSSGKLVSIGEAVGVIAAQSIGEPGTQLTMRTFHTGGVFAAGLTDQILAPFDGQIEFLQNIPGTCIRTSLSTIAFLTKAPGSFFLKKNEKDNFSLRKNISETEKAFSRIQPQSKFQKKNSNFSEIYKIPSYAILFVRNREFVQKKQLLAQFSTVLKKQVQYGTAEQTLYSTFAGEFYLGGSPPVFSSIQKKNSLKFSTPFFPEREKTSPSESFFSHFLRNLEFQRFNTLEKQSTLLNFGSGQKNTGQNKPGKIDLIIEKRKNDSSDFSEMEQKHDLFWKSKNWTNIWILSGHMFSNSLTKDIFLKDGDCLKTTSIFTRILWKKRKQLTFFSSVSNLKQKESTQFSLTDLANRFEKDSQKEIFQHGFCFSSNHEKRKTKKELRMNMFYLLAFEKSQKSADFFFSNSFDFTFFSSLFLPCEQIKKNQTNRFNLQSNQKKIHTRFKNTEFFQINASLKFLHNVNSQQFLKKVPFFHGTSFLKQKKFSQKLGNFKKMNIFSTNFQKIFTFLQKPKKLNHKKQKYPRQIQKKQSKQLFFKFSTFNTNSFSLDNSYYSKILKLTKKTIDNSRSLPVLTQNFFSSVFPFSTKYSQGTRARSLQKNQKKRKKLQKKNQFKSEKFRQNSISTFVSQNSNFLSLLFSRGKNQKTANRLKFRNFERFNQILLENRTQTNFVSSKIKENGLSLFFTLKKQPNHKKKSLNQFESQKTLFFKKSILSFQFDRLRSNKFGYVSTSSNSFPENRNSFFAFDKTKKSSSSFQFFLVTRQQEDFELFKTTNPGKNEILLGNSNFVGKDFSRFLGYCFPKTSQTSTNGIFTLLSFKKNSLNKRVSKFLCLKGTFLENVSFFFSQKKKSSNTQSFPLVLTNGKKKFDTFDHRELIPTGMKIHTKFHGFHKEVFRTSSFLFADILNSSNRLKLQKQRKKRKLVSAEKVFFFKITTFEFFQSYSNSKQFFFSFLLNQQTPFHSDCCFSFFSKGKKDEDKKNVKEKTIEENNNNENISNCPPFFQHQKRIFSFSNFDKLFNRSFLSNLSLTHCSPSNSFLKAQNHFFQKQFSTNFFVFFKKKRNPLKKQTNFQNVGLYTEEICWIPQENFVLSNVKFLELTNQTQTSKNSNEKMLVFRTASQKKKSPLFYLVNRQGKKKPFFSSLQGFYSCSPFLKGQNISKILFVNGKSLPSQSQNKEKFDYTVQKVTFFPKNSKARKFSKKGKKQKGQPFKVQFFQKQNFRDSIQETFLKFSKVVSLNLHKKFTVTKILRSPKFFEKNIQQKRTSQRKNQCFQRFFLKKRSFQFLKIHSNFYSKKIQKKNFPFWNRFKKDSQFQISKVKKTFQKNFSSGFIKNKKKKKLQRVQKLFGMEFGNDAKAKKSNMQIQFAKKSSNHCFTCFPVQNVLHKNSPLKKERPTIFLKSHQIHIKIQSGWVYVLPNFFQTLEFHQKIANQGHLWQTNLVFGQNKVLSETLIFKKSPFRFKQNKNTNQCFSVKSLFKNSNCRFANEGGLYAIQNFSAFQSFQTKKQIAILFRPFQYKLLENPQNLKKFFLDSSRQFTENLCFFPKGFFSFGKKQKTQTKNKKFTKLSESSDFSCFELFQKYHSPLLNSQTLFKMFLDNPLNFDFELCSDFQKIQVQKKSQQNFGKEKRNFFKNLKRNHSFSESRFHKKQILQKFSFFKQYSNKYRFPKFNTLVTRDNLRTVHLAHTPFFCSPKTESLRKHSLSFPQIFLTGKFQNGSGQTKTSKMKRKKGKLKNLKDLQNFSYFFSYYPVQFLPIRISYCFVNNEFNSFSSSSNISNAQKIPTISVHALTKKIDFCIFEKKSAFSNQRVFFSNLFENSKNTSFWLNKDGLQFHDSLSDFSFQSRSTKRENLFLLNKSKNFLKFSNTMKNFTSLISERKNHINVLISEKNELRKFSSKRQTIQKSKQILLKNSFFQKNPNFYGNTKFYSPYEGEVLSMVTNEKLWWKKASEISTIQKVNKLFTIVTKTDFFSLKFPTKNNEVQIVDFDTFDLSNFTKEKTSLLLKQTKQFEFSLQTKQKHLLGLYEILFKNEKNSIFSTNFGLDSNRNTLKVMGNQKNGKHQNSEQSVFMTKYETKIYKFQNGTIGYPNLSKKPTLGTFFVYGDCIFQNAVRKPGQIVHLNRVQMTLRKGQPFLVSPKGILHFSNIPYIKKNVPLLTLPYQTVQSGDIVQGIPKVEQYFEARTTIQGRLFVSSLPILLKGIFERYKVTLPLEQATRQSFLKLQQIVVDGVQRVYRSQGVSITDKHLEVVVRQMTTKVQIIHGAQTGFFPGELVNLDLVERINKFLMVKIRYEPVILGITRASLEVDSFLSASSFQQTTKILALASISRKKDFLKGLKENLLVGNLIPSGTGYLVLSKNSSKL